MSIVQMPTIQVGRCNYGAWDNVHMEQLVDALKSARPESCTIDKFKKTPIQSEDRRLRERGLSLSSGDARTMKIGREERAESLCRTPPCSSRA